MFSISQGIRGLQFMRHLHINTKEALQLVETQAVGLKAVARNDLLRGTIINVFRSPILSSPTMHTVMLDEATHVAPTEGAECISHACDATNTRIIIHEDRKGASFVVTEDVAAGEDLTFNYNTTEWDMNSPFTCQCAACKQKGFPTVVRGFKHLSLEERSRIADEASPLILKQSAEDSSRFSNLVDTLQKNEASYFSPIEDPEESVGSV